KHATGNEPRDVDRRPQVEVDHLVHVLVTDQREHPLPGNPRIVDQYVDPTEPLDHVLDERGPGGLVGEVYRLVVKAPPDVLRTGPGIRDWRRRSAAGGHVVA